MARPSKLTPERRKAIIDMIGYGVFAETAARAAGISPSTYYLWLQRGNTGEAPFSEFRTPYALGKRPWRSRPCRC